MKFKYFLIAVGLCMIIGCSHGDNPIADMSSNVHTAKNYPGVFGAWKVRVDTSSLTAGIVPARNARAIGDIFDADLSQFLTKSPCSNCLQIANIRLNEYNMIEMEFRMKHPFSNIAVRPDLHGFDVRGIFVTDYILSPLFNGINVMKPDGSTEPALMPTGVMLNPDGYTSHFDSLVSDQRYFPGGEDVPGNINPFLRFFEDTSDVPFDPYDPRGHNVMRVGSDYYSRTAVFSLGSIAYDVLEFYLIADVAYGQSAKLSNRLNPTYYLPSFNRTEPWRVEYWIENNNLSPSNPDSAADVVIQIFDWQQNAIVDENYPDPVHLDRVRESSKVAKLELQITGMMYSPVVVEVPEAGAGTPSDPLRYRLQVKNEKLAVFNQMGLLAVRDELYGAASPHGRIPIPESPSGFPYSTEDIRDYTLYQEIWINFPSSDPLKFNNELAIYNTSTSADTIKLYPTFFMDIGHTKFRYYWDFNYDGVTFDPDGMGLPSPNIPVNPGMQTIGLGVITRSVPPRQYIYSIPVAKIDEIHRGYVTGEIDPMEMVSMRGQHSLAITSEVEYIAYVSTKGGKPDIWVAIGDKRGNFTSTNATVDFPDSCFNPSMVAIEAGANKGIYIIFEVYDGADFDLYSTFGNLDGTGFAVGNIKNVADDPGIDERDACLVQHDDKLFAFYTAINSPTDSDVYAAVSSDFATTWIPSGAIHTYTTGNQRNPSVAYCPAIDRIVCVWQDDRALGTRGTDIYVTATIDGVTFDPEVCISAKTVQASHTEPGISILDDQIGIVYESSIAGDSAMYLKIINPSMTTFSDYQIQAIKKEMRIGKPSVTSSSKGKFYVSFSTYTHADTKLETWLLKINSSSDIAGFGEEVIFNDTIGNSNYVDSVNSSVASRAVPTGINGVYNGIEVLGAWTSYKDGFAEITDPQTMYLGRVESIGLLEAYY